MGQYFQVNVIKNKFFFLFLCCLHGYVTGWGNTIRCCCVRKPKVLLPIRKCSDERLSVWVVSSCDDPPKAMCLCVSELFLAHQMCPEIKNHLGVFVLQPGVHSSSMCLFYPHIDCTNTATHTHKCIPCSLEPKCSAKLRLVDCSYKKIEWMKAHLSLLSHQSRWIVLYLFMESMC